jgi:hypothetical protein
VIGLYLKALASSDEIDITTLLAGSMDEYRKALGALSVKAIFANYQAETLKVLKDHDYVEGSNSENYILTDHGERALKISDLINELDTIKVELEDPYTLFDTIPRNTLLESSEKIIEATNGTINFPKLLILSLLYTKWKTLFSLDKNDEDQIRSYITNDLSLNITGSIFKEGEDGTGEILNISGETSGQIGILIDTDEENDIKKIHVGSFMEEVNVPETLIGELDNGEINGLWQALNTTPPLPPQYEVVKEERGYSIKGGVNNNFYIYIRDSNSLRVYKDRSADQNLRVQESGNKLKVYRKRE